MVAGFGPKPRFSEYGRKSSVSQSMASVDGVRPPNRCSATYVAPATRSSKHAAIAKIRSRRSRRTRCLIAMNSA